MFQDLTQIPLDVATLQKNETVQLVCTRLGYGDAARGVQLLVSVDDFLRGFVTTTQVNGVEVGCVVDNDEALDETAIGWLDDEGNGRLFWPCLLPEQRHEQPQYDDFDHTLIVRETKILIQTMNQLRQQLSTTAANCVQKFDTKVSISPRKFAAIAQATLLSHRRSVKLDIQTGSNDVDLLRTLSCLVDYEGIQSTFGLKEFDELSRKLQVELSKDHVVSLPSFFFPLQRFGSDAEQEQIARRSLDYLHNNGIIALQIGMTVEKRLQEAAKACGKLCFRLAYELPPELSDEELPDLLAKLTVLEFGRLIAPQTKSGTR